MNTQLKHSVIIYSLLFLLLFLTLVLLTCLLYVFHEDRDFAVLLTGRQFCCFAYWFCTPDHPPQNLIHAEAVKHSGIHGEGGDTPSDLGAAGSQREEPFILHRRRCLSRSQMIEIIEAWDHGKTSFCPSWTLLFSRPPLVLPTPPCSPPRLPAE